MDSRTTQQRQWNSASGSLRADLLDKTLQLLEGRGAVRSKEPSFVGRYRLLGELGVGGMATVHLARSTSEGSFEKLVALKVGHRHLSTDVRAIRMFLTEARIVSRITHPNVVEAYDMGRHAGRYFIAMEYLPGQSVRDLMKRSQERRAGIPLEIACRIVADIAHGLHAAHEQRDRRGRPLGLVHRDVSPHNMIVTWDGVTKIIDFGIAHATVKSPCPDTGPFNGKLSYLSPEQARGLPIDRRSDIFSLGIVLWELITGRRLFSAPTELDTVVRLLDCNVTPPASIMRRCPLNLDEIVMRALARDPAERYPTMQSFARSLTSMLVARGSAFGAAEVSEYMHETFADRSPTLPD